MGQWCSGRPVYQTSDHAEESEEDLLCGGSEEPEEAEEDVLCGSSEEANIEREVERQEEENIDKESGRGERLLVRGGYWEVQVGSWHFQGAPLVRLEILSHLEVQCLMQMEKIPEVEFPLLQSTKGL